MARYTAIIFVLVNCMPFETAAQDRCSTAGVAGLAGCECFFVGACDVGGIKIPGLDISKNSPNGLEAFAHAGRNLAFLCEGTVVNALAILYDCNNRIPLYAATVITGSKLSVKYDSGRPRGGDGKFRSSTKLDLSFQQNDNDYLKAKNRELQIHNNRKRKYDDMDDKDPAHDWIKAKNGPLSSPNRFIVAMHRGHLIASMYGIGDYQKKKQTFVYTNAIPQFGDFNSVPWRICEQNLITWGRLNCLNEGTKYGGRNVQMFIVVGVIPSTINKDPKEWRFFGSGGFSILQNKKNFSVNVPSAMWTAACCTYDYTKDKRTFSATQSTAFWRENKPGKEDCTRIDVNALEVILTKSADAQVNLFPSFPECRNYANYVQLPFK